jgi:predicted nucleotidyltransferase
MQINSDFKDLLRCLNEEQVRYLIIGGYAVMIYTEPFYTKDLDIWIEPTIENAAATLTALSRFGAPSKTVTANDLLNPEIIYQIGVDPVRVDVISDVPGVLFADAWLARQEVQFEDVGTFVISREHLIMAKESSGRKQDRDALKRLKKP